MSQVVAEPNEELAILLLAAGHDEHELRKHAGYPSLRAAREFASRSDTRSEVSKAVEARAARVGIKGLAAIEQMLDSDLTDGRTRIAAARTALEFAGMLRKGAQPSPEDKYRSLSAPELSVLIAQTKAELAERTARRAPSDSSHPVTVIASS